MLAILPPTTTEFLSGWAKLSKLPPLIVKMSTFERVKRNILRDMNSSSTHTAESWANIMLTNCSNLHSVEEQKKFWAWLQNPMGDERADPICEVFDSHLRINEEKVTKFDDDEKSPTYLKNTYNRNGSAMFIKSVPCEEKSSV